VTRKSKRELESALEAFDDTTPGADRPAIDDVYPGPVATFIQRVARDLLRISHTHPDEVVNAPEPAATRRFLALVRERYDLGEDRDDAVYSALEATVAGHEHGWAVDQFAIAPVSVAKATEPETAAGESLSALVNTNREDEAERLLVQTTYDTLADRGDRGVEVAA